MPNNPSESSTELTGPMLDHLALASNHAWDNVIRYCYHLGARWMGGASEDEMTAFYFAQVEFDGGTKLEFLQPNPDPGSDFIRRFLHRNGPGPHHFTFKVPDIAAAITEVDAAGYSVVNENFSDPEWQEAFLHPKQSHGIVIQLAQPGTNAEWDNPGPLPPSPQTRRPKIAMVKHLVADLDTATKLFAGPLAMCEGDRGSNVEGSYVDLQQGPWTLRLIEPTADAYGHWLGDRPGRLLQINIEVDEPALVPGLRRVGDFWEIPPDRNQGTRVLLRRLPR